jgi:hypothetical protein
MKNLYWILLLVFCSCGEQGITLEEARKKDSLTNSEFNMIVRKEHDLALEGLKLLPYMDEDTAARRRVLMIHDEIEAWRDLVKEKLPPNFVPSPEQNRMFSKVLEFEEQFKR